MRFRFLSFLPAIVACGPVPLEARDPDPGAAHFVVQSYNVKEDKYADASTVDAVGAANADIICLQEVTPDWEQALKSRYADVYPYMLFHPLEGAEGLGFLSRFPLRDLGVLEEPHGWHPAWHAEAETDMGRVHLLNVHLRSMFTGRSNVVTAYFSTNADHVEEMRRFAEARVEGVPTIVLGDFNEGPDGPALQFLEGDGFRNALPLFHPGQPTWHNPPAWQMEQAIDHVLFDHAFTPLNAWVENIGNSDHLPVLLHVQDASF